MLGYILELYRENGEENGDYCSILEYIFHSSKNSSTLNPKPQTLKAWHFHQASGLLTPLHHLSHSLDSLKGVLGFWGYIGDDVGEYYRGS